jgi:FMN reductase
MGVSPVQRPAMAPKVVLLSGNTKRPSQSRALAARIGERLAQLREVELLPLDLHDAGRSLGAAYLRTELSAAAEFVVSSIESADALVVVTPVHNGSYPGLFKHLIDFVARGALAQKPILLGASGGSRRQAMIIDHQLRPLFSFFEAQISAYSVFEFVPDLATETERAQSRIDVAAGHFCKMLDFTSARQ